MKYQAKCESFRKKAQTVITCLAPGAFSPTSMPTTSPQVCLFHLHHLLSFYTQNECHLSNARPGPNTERPKSYWDRTSSSWLLSLWSICSFHPLHPHLGTRHLKCFWSSTHNFKATQSLWHEPSKTQVLDVTKISQDWLQQKWMTSKTSWMPFPTTSPEPSDNSTLSPSELPLPASHWQHTT